MRRVVVAAAVLGAFLTKGPPAAHATTKVTWTQAGVLITAGDGDRNKLSVSQYDCSYGTSCPNGGSLRISDSGALLTPSGSFCQHDGAVIECFYGDPDSTEAPHEPPATFFLVIDLGDKADTATLNMDSTFKSVLVEGGEGDDNLTGSLAQTTLVKGQKGDDTITALAKTDTVEGGKGDDTILAVPTDCYDINGNNVGSAGSTTFGYRPTKVKGGSGTDTMSFATQDPDCSSGGQTGITLALTSSWLDGVENLAGSAGDDHLTGDSGKNTIDGGSGTDVIDGGKGDDKLTGETVDGGSGDDKLFGSRLDGGKGDDTLKPGDDGVVSEDGGGGDDKLTGDDNGTEFSDGSGDDKVTGGDGPDTLTAGKGKDVYSGGGDRDVISFADRKAGVTVKLNGDADDGESGEHDNVQGFEVVHGTAYSDTISGNQAAETIDGAGGGDTIKAGGGDDVIDGNRGDDHINGGAGNDTIDAGADDDTVFAGTGDDAIKGGPGADSVHGGDGSDEFRYDDHTSAGIFVALDGKANDGNATDHGSSDVVHASQDEPIAQPDPAARVADRDNIAPDVETVGGSSFDDHLVGSAGNDTLYGNGGVDTLDGLEGDDQLWANLVNIPVVEPPAAGDTLRGGPGNDSLFGSELDDTLFGGPGDDALDGHGGDDQLFGGPGTDTITCGTGNDTVHPARGEAAEPVGADCEQQGQAGG